MIGATDAGSAAATTFVRGAGRMGIDAGSVGTTNGGAEPVEGAVAEAGTGGGCRSAGAAGGVALALSQDSVAGDAGGAPTGCFSDVACGAAHEGAGGSLS